MHFKNAKAYPYAKEFWFFFMCHLYHAVWNWFFLLLRFFLLCFYLNAVVNVLKALELNGKQQQQQKQQQKKNQNRFLHWTMVLCHSICRDIDSHIMIVCIVMVYVIIFFVCTLSLSSSAYSFGKPSAIFHLYLLNETLSFSNHFI